jgi:hypothetical protein
MVLEEEILPGLVRDGVDVARPGASKKGPAEGDRVKLGVVVKTYVRSDPTGDSSVDSSEHTRMKKRKNKILRSAMNDSDISLANANGMDMDDLTVDSPLPADKIIFVNQKFVGKPLPGFIRLAPHAPKHPNVVLADLIMKDSVNAAAVVRSSYSEAPAGMVMRRSTTNQPMDERTRAISPVSGYRERNRLEGFKEPPRDYLKALSPIDHKLILKKYGYGTSPQKKGELLEQTILARYAGTDRLNERNENADIIRRQRAEDKDRSTSAKIVKGNQSAGADVAPGGITDEFESLDSLFEASLSNLSVSRELEATQSTHRKSSPPPAIPPGMIVALADPVTVTDASAWVQTLESVAEQVNPPVRPGPSALQDNQDVLASYSVLSRSQKSTGMPLSKGTGSKVKLKQSNAKITPAARRRLKILAEKEKSKVGAGRQPVVVKQVPMQQLNSIKLRNPTSQSVQAPDPRPGALPPATLPYYDPATYRQAATLEDKLRNMPDLGDVDLLSFASLENYSSDVSVASVEELEAKISSGPHDPHAWRRNFLKKKIRFPDALDSDEEDRSRGLSAEPDTFNFSAALLDPEPDEADEAEEEVLEDGSRRVLVSPAVPAVLDPLGNVVEPAMEAVYDLIPAIAFSSLESVGGSAGPASVHSSITGSHGSRGEYMSLTGSAHDPTFPGAEPEGAVKELNNLTTSGSVRSQGNNAMVVTGGASTSGFSPDSPDARCGTAGFDASLAAARASVISVPQAPPLIEADAYAPLKDHLFSPNVSQSVSQISAPDVTDESETSEAGPGSISSDMQRHKAQNASDLEEQRKNKRRESHRAAMRAKKLRELEEEEANKQALFIANHVDPSTAKRVDYKFPEHGVQQPGVGEAHIRYRDYADDSMFLGSRGAVMTQKDPFASTLLDTVLLDVRLRSPVYGDREARPLSPSQRENLMMRSHQDHMFQLLMSGSPPPSPDMRQRKLQHQIVLLSTKLKESVDLSTEPFITYVAFPDSRPEIPASQRFRMEAEEQRLERETEMLAKSQAKIEAKEAKDRAALLAAGIKPPRRKKLQAPKAQATTQAIPVAYSVGPTKGGGVGCSVVSTHPPSLVYKPKKKYTKELKPPPDMAEINCIPPSQKLGAPMRVPEIRVSKGTVVFTRDNRALDPDGGLPEVEHELWADSQGSDKADLAALLAMNANMREREQLRSRSPGTGTGSRTGTGTGTGRDAGRAAGTAGESLGGGASVHSQGSAGTRGSAEGSRTGTAGKTRAGTTSAREGASRLAGESIISLNSGKHD